MWATSWAKFLVAREVTNQGSRFARGVLSGLDWGAEDDLFLPQDVHARCAMEVVNAHKAHCKTRNSSIGKSITKSAKLLLKVSDPEQEFDRWCWSILIRLKIVPKPLANPPENDLTAFFVYLQEKCLSSPEMFVESGLNYWVELVNASCFYGAGVVLLKLVEKFPARVHLFTANEKFKAALDALFAADGTSYVHQFFNPNDRFPGPILRLLSSGLSHQFDKQANQTQLKPLLNGWMQLLTCKRPTSVDGPTTILNAWKDAPKGVFSWFATPSPPRLIESADLPHAPWASYLMLRAETEAPAHAKFFESLHANLAKHPKRELDEAVKRTATKVQWNIGVSQLPYFRWLEMCTQKAVRNDPFVFPLALQQLATSMLLRVKVGGKDSCFGDRYFASPSSKHLFDELAKALAEAEKETNSGPLGSFFRATSVWIHTPSIYAPNFNNFHDVPMDFLLQRIFTGDRHPWVELLDMKGLRERVVAEANVFAGFCHLVHPAPPTSSSAAHPQTISELFQHLQLTPADLKFFPVVPLHQNLPASGLLAFDDAQNAQVVSGRLNTAVEELVKIAKAFLESKDKIEVLNDEYGQKFRHLYTIQQTTLSVKMQCGSAFLAANCRRPGIQTVVVDDASRYDSEVAMAMNENRMKRENLITELLQTLDNTAIISARIEFICWMLNAYSRQQAAFEPPPVYSAKGMEMMRDPVSNPVQNSGRCLSSSFPPLTNGIQCCLHHLGVAFIAEHPAEQMNLLRIVISGHPLDVSEFFTPHSVSADELHKLYTELSSGIRNASTKEASMALLKRLDIQHAGQKLPPNQFSSLLPVIFENLASVAMDTPLHSLCGTHFEHAMFHAFPHNFVSGLRLLLSGCDSHCVPLALFHSVVRHFSMDEFFANANKAISAAKCTISVELAGESVRVIAEQLKKSRHELSTRLFAIWVDYLGLVLKIADFFVRSIVCQQFNSTLLPSTLHNVFLLVLTVWGPLLEPVGPSALAPWNPADQELANGVVGRFVELLAWLPHSTFLPPSSECVEKLFFEYFARTLAALQRSGSSHIYPVFESKCVALNWTRFSPNLMDMAALEHVLVDGQPEAAPFLVDVIVRVNWRDVVLHMNGQPTDAHRAFYSLLLTVLSRIVARTSNYAKSRALWRESCCFTTTPRSIGLPADSADMKVDVIAAKQAMFVHSHVHLLLRSKLSIEDQCRQYKELLDKCYLQIGAASSGKSEKPDEKDLQQFAPIAKELIAFWPQISKDKHLDAFFHTMTQWLNDHPESVLLLLVMHVVMSALGKSAPQLGLKLLDKSVMTYFKRKLSCDWQEICRWIRIPENMKEWLYTTPSSDAGIEPRFLTLNAHLLNEMSRLSSAPEEERVMRRLGEYLQSIKPKHIQSEVSFVCVLEKYQRMVVRQYANGVPVGIANEQMEVFISFLRKIFSEDKGVSLFNVRAMFSKKAAFPIRLQLLAHIISLYLTQQQTSLSQPPRQTAGQPVLCSRISAFRELQTERRYQEVENSSTIFQFALPYFNQPESHTLQHVSTLFFRIADLLYPDSSKLLRHLGGTV
ncbi:hypothetical protein M3Y99_00847100 [Aphelenchoides fujianensis]|nr:hypothetical protein M3Y99_00847100 [Aphelenchoides fujianensis]